MAMMEKSRLGRVAETSRGCEAREGWLNSTPELAARSRSGYARSRVKEIAGMFPGEKRWHRELSMRPRPFMGEVFCFQAKSYLNALTRRTLRYAYATQDAMCRSGIF